MLEMFLPLEENIKRSWTHLVKKAELFANEMNKKGKLLIGFCKRN